MKKCGKTKILSIILAIATVLTMVPVIALTSSAVIIITITERLEVTEGVSVTLIKGATYTCPDISQLSGADANQGGVIKSKTGSTVTGENITFSGNKATQGGAVKSIGNLSLSGTTVFKDNTSTVAGGAIHFANSGSTATITGNSSFNGNSAGQSGGAIYNSGTLTFNGDSTFTENSARSNGGAIYIFNDTSLLTFSGKTTFNGNAATGAGGAIYNNKATVTFSDTVDLQTETDTWVNTGYYNKNKSYATVNWDLTGGLEKYGCIKNFQRYSNATSDVEGTPTALVNQNIIVSATQPVGEYIIATGDFTDVTNKNAFTIKTAEDAGTAIAIGDTNVSYKNSKYTLKVDNNGTTEDKADDKLVLTVIPPVTITITADSAGWTYDGKAHTWGEYTVTNTELLKDGDELTAETSGEITDFGTAKNTIISYAVKRSGIDVTSEYNIVTVDGTLTVYKRDVTLTSGSGSKAYDGAPLTNGNVTETGDGFAAGEGATYNVTGSQTQAGTSANTFTYTLTNGAKADNYDITAVEGTLTVYKDDQMLFNERKTEILSELGSLDKEYYNWVTRIYINKAIEEINAIEFDENKSYEDNAAQMESIFASTQQKVISRYNFIYSCPFMKLCAHIFTWIAFNLGLVK